MGPSGKWIDGLLPDASVVDAARMSLSARLTAVAHWLPLAAYHAAQDIEHVHRLRTSTRRAMAAVQLYRDWLPPRKRRSIKKRLKKLRRAAGEARARYELTPEKFEMWKGKLFWNDTQRLTLLALLLENVGADQAVRLGDPEVWRAAVRSLG